MDDYDLNDRGAPTSEDDVYEVLNDPRRVMMEVVALVEDLHHAVTRLGDAIAAAGLPAREWRTADCRLLLLADQFPDITLDALITRLAEFAAGMGPHWLHGDRADIAQFNDEVAILYSVVRPLRTTAQRLRMVPVRERGDLPIERALGDGRVGTPLDRVAAVLRDLDSLGPYLVPLAAEEWQDFTSAPPMQPPSVQSPSVQSPSVQSPPVPSFTPSPAIGADATVMQPHTPGASLPIAVPPATPPPAVPPTSSSQSFRRLRDFMPPPEERRSAVGIQGRDWSWLRADASVWARALLEWMKPRKWLVIGIAIMLLALGTALLTLARQSALPTAVTPASHLTASPADVTLTCSGKSSSLKLTLRDTGTQSLTWSIKAPSGLSISTTHGTLKPGATVTLTIKVASAKAAHGTLAFTSSDGAATIPYTVSCT
jgi:Viral BACON domain